MTYDTDSHKTANFARKHNLKPSQFQGK